MSQPPANPHDSPLLSLEPVPGLLERVRQDLSAGLRTDRPIRISRAPGRLDVMGGIADYTGAQVCEYPLGCGAAVASQERDDRQLRIFSFNLLDENKPFTFGIGLDDLIDATAQELQREFASDVNRRWASYIAGCVFVLHEAGVVDLRASNVRGLDLAILSTVPLGAGVSSSAALEVATMLNLIDHYSVRSALEPLRIAELCQQAEHRIVGAPCGIMDQVTCLLAEENRFLRLQCQPHTLLPSLSLPNGIRVLGINTGIRHDVTGDRYAHTRCAAFMAQRIILEHMRAIGRSQSRELLIDPMDGYLANLDPDDYKRLFREHLPHAMKGADFIARFGGHDDPVTRVERDVTYAVLGAADHHVLEARRVQNFVRFIEQANAIRFEDGHRTSLLDKAGHLMYASHLSYTNDAHLGAPECDLLVELVRQREHAGLYGAKITGGGQGGTVAVLCNDNSRASIALADIVNRYREQTGIDATVLLGTSPGAWQLGTVLQSPA